MNKIKAAFFDIDGTLLSFATRRVPASAVRALEGMRAAGIRLFIASGRPPMYLAPLRAELDFRFDGYVLTNGQCCTDAEGVPFYNRALPAGSVPALLRWLEEHPDVVCTFCEEDYVYDNRHSEAVDARCRASGMGLPHHPIEDPARALSHVTYQLNAYMPPALDAPFAAAVPGFRAVRWNEVFADVIPADGGKTEGMARMLARFGLTPAESIAFGDGGNDIEMLRAAGIGVAMGNGPRPSRRRLTTSPPAWTRTASGKRSSISGCWSTAEACAAPQGDVVTDLRGKIGYTRTIGRGNTPRKPRTTGRAPRPAKP